MIRAAVCTARTIQHNNLLFIILYNIYNLLFIRLAVITHNWIVIRHPTTIIICGAFVSLAVKWPLHTQRVSRIAVKALVTSNIIQSVCLVGKGRLKERCWLEPRTNFFLFKISAETSADQIRVWIRFENIRYVLYIPPTAFTCLPHFISIGL